MTRTDLRQATVSALSLFLLNLCLVYKLLLVEFHTHMGSIEGTHIALGRWVLENWPDLTWFPLWYGGIPYQNAYPPLHPLITASVAGALGLSPAHAYHVVTALFYSLGPVTLFLLSRKLSGSWRCGLGAGLVYSVLSPSAFLLPAVRHDVGRLWHARRLQALVQYGEGPHIASMTLVPLALLLVIVAFDKRRPWWWFLAALGLASVALTNWLGAVTLAVAIAAWLLARQEGRWWRNWLTVALLGLWAYAMACVWIPPSTVLTVRRNESYVSGALSGYRWLLVAGLAVVVMLLLCLFRRFRVSYPLRFASLFLLPMALLPLAREYGGWELMPQPHRYHLEMEMALVLALAFAARAATERLPRPIRAFLTLVLLVACAYPALRYRRYARDLINPIDIHSTVEYRVAKWLDSNMHGQRVFLSGSTGFWLNAFNDTPQLCGGFDQGTENPILPAVRYQLLTGENARRDENNIAVAWLKALGIDAVCVGGPRSRDAFKPFHNLRKFEGLLPVAWREGDDTIYRVPRRSPSLAHVIRLGDLPARKPEHGLDLDPVRTYLDAVEDSDRSPATLAWTSPHSATVSATMRRDEILSVQVAYHSGWNASLNGQPRRVYGDELGQLVVEPHCEGDCRVTVLYDGGTESKAARFISWTALAGGLLWILVASYTTSQGAAVSSLPR